MSLYGGIFYLDLVAGVLLGSVDFNSFLTWTRQLLSRKFDMQEKVDEEM